MGSSDDCCLRGARSSQVEAVCGALAAVEAARGCSPTGDVPVEQGAIGREVSFVTHIHVRRLMIWCDPNLTIIIESSSACET